MPDGTDTQPTGETSEQPNEPPLTADEQIDQQVNQVQVLENLPMVGAVYQFAYQSGGGGEGGHFAIESVEELQALKTRWEGVALKIRDTRETLRHALDSVKEPAQDGPSSGEAGATRTSIQQAIKHNQIMFEYAESYAQKLQAAIDDYSGTEDSNVSHVNNADG